MTGKDETRREHIDRLIVEARRAGITSHRELANFLAQAEIETGYFTRFSENLNYRPERLLGVFRGRNGMDTLEEAQAVAKGGPEGIANAMYGGRWGQDNLGNTEAGDGWRFRGRGYFQITGRDNYEAMSAALSKRFGVDLVANPDRLAEPGIAAAAAVEYWRQNVVRKGYQLDVDLATGAINTARLHLGERRAAAAEWEQRLDQGYEPKTSDRQLPPHQSLPRRPVDPANPVHSLFESALSGIEAIERERGIDSGEHSTKLAWAIAGDAAKYGLKQIDRVEFNDRNTLVRGVHFAGGTDDWARNLVTSPVDIGATLEKRVDTLTIEAVQAQARVLAPEAARQETLDAPRRVMS